MSMCEVDVQGRDACSLFAVGCEQSWVRAAEGETVCDVRHRPCTQWAERKHGALLDEMPRLVLVGFEQFCRA